MKLVLPEKTRKFALFLRKGVSDVFYPNRFGVSARYPHHNAWPYALDYTVEGMRAHYGITFDTEGIPIMRHDIKQGRDVAGERYYHPLKIAHHALAVYNDYLKKGTSSLADQFRTNVHYLAESAEAGPGGGVVWRVPRVLTRYGTPRGHVSSIVQGLVISALCRSYVLDSNRLHIDLARQATRVLRIPVEEGGVLARSQWGDMYEEYPAQPYSHVVNGFIFCLIGLHDLKAIGKSPEATRLFREGVETLVAVIPEWIEERWSKYDLRDVVNGEAKNYATLHYQLLHIDQMEIMYRVTGNDYFRVQKEKLKRQAKHRSFLLNVYVRKIKKYIFQSFGSGFQ